MKVNGYSSDELKSFHRVLQAAMAEISARRTDVPIADMIARLFEAADKGERDPAKLMAAALPSVRSATASTPSKTRAQRATAIALKPRTNRQILTLFPRARLSPQQS